MKKLLPKSIDLLTEKLSLLPGIGPKTASRLTFVLLQRPQSFMDDLAEALSSLKTNLSHCPECFLITERSEKCVICAEDRRDKSMMCVVEEPLDVVAVESSGGYNGLYHVLGGVISPIDGIGPDQIRIKELVDRVNNNKEIREVIIATNPSLEGEATALYIGDRLKKYHLEVTRIARGLPIGGDLEYADEVTLQRAMEGRQPVKDKEEKYGI